MPTVILPERMLIAVTGADAAHLLHNVLTCDVEKLEDGIAQPGALLTPQGKVMFDFLVARDGNGFIIDIDRAQADAFLKRMMLYKMRSKVDFTKQDQHVIAVSWDSESDTSQTDSSRCWHDGRFSGMVTRHAAPGKEGSVNGADLAAWHQLRVTHGVAESGMDFELGEAFGHDISFDQNGGLDFKKGCYVGQEVVSRMQHRGTARRRIVIVQSGGDLPPSGTAIEAGGKQVGALGTVVGSSALAIVRLDRVAKAHASNAPITAGGVALQMQLPPGVTYQWPGLSAPAEDNA